MRVGVNATPILVPQKTGIERYASELVFALVEQVETTPNLDLYLYLHAGNPFADEKLLERYQPIIRKAHCCVYSPRRGFGLILFLMAMKDRLHLLHLLTSIPPWFKPCATLLTIHHIGASLPKQAQHIERSASRRSASKAIRMADGFIAVSRDAANDLENACSVSPDRVWVVQHGVNHIEDSIHNYESVASKYRLNQYILFVGALQYRKNLVRLLQAYALLRSQYRIPHKLVLTGRDGPGCEQVYNEIDRLKLHPQVKLLGYVPDDELWSLYSEASLFVYPSIHEGFGIPILEAMSSGTVVAAAHTSSIPEVGGDAVIYFDPYDVQEMAGAIYEGLTNRSLRKALKAQGVERARRFTWQRAAKDTLDVYRTLSGG
jgi:glycosyltransferase involved in cell wall biosynthesis